MSIQNLAIVFAQTLWSDETRPRGGSMAGHGNGVMADAPFQNKLIIRPFFFSLDPLFIFAAFTGGRDNIIILL